MTRVTAIVLVLGTLVLFGCTPAYPAQPEARMPALHQYVKTDEDVAPIPSCGIVVGVRGYNSIGSEDAPWFKLIAVYRTFAERPFLVFMWADETDDESELTAYFDYNLDGVVDEQRVIPVEDQNSSLACNAYGKITRVASAN